MAREIDPTMDSRDYRKYGTSSHRTLDWNGRIIYRELDRIAREQTTRRFDRMVFLPETVLDCTKLNLKLFCNNDEVKSDIVSVTRSANKDILVQLTSQYFGIARLQEWSKLTGDDAVVRGFKIKAFDNGQYIASIRFDAVVTYDRPNRYALSVENVHVTDEVHGENLNTAHISMELYNNGIPLDLHIDTVTVTQNADSYFGVIVQRGISILAKPIPSYYTVEPHIGEDIMRRWSILWEEVRGFRLDIEEEGRRVSSAKFDAVCERLYDGTYKLILTGQPVVTYTDKELPVTVRDVVNLFKGVC